jgi:hypothetical protein
MGIDLQKEWVYFHWKETGWTLTKTFFHGVWNVYDDVGDYIHSPETCAMGVESCYRKQIVFDFYHVLRHLRKTMSNEHNKHCANLLYPPIRAVDSCRGFYAYALPLSSPFVISRFFVTPHPVQIPPVKLRFLRLCSVVSRPNRMDV